MAESSLRAAMSASILLLALMFEIQYAWGLSSVMPNP